MSKCSDCEAIGRVVIDGAILCATCAGMTRANERLDHYGATE